MTNSRNKGAAFEWEIANSWNEELNLTIPLKRILEQTREKFLPDLILMDIQLPEVSGLEVAKWIKDDHNLSDIPIVAITVFAMKGDQERILDGGCEAYLSKPISISTFLDTIGNLVN